jgi:transcription elongation GreA/GreB family factor
MSDANMYVTKETFDRLREELHRMKAIDRPAASKAIAEAREKGDLKENAEYDAAKEAQGMLEAKIKQLGRGHRQCQDRRHEFYRHQQSNDPHQGYDH